MKETGYGKDVGESWFGMLAPAGTPPEIVEKMAKAIDEAIKSPDVLDKLDKGGAKPTYLGPADMRATVDKESAMFADIIKRGNVHL
jgi:tripartite-type tricarboxylate transporter receptor subunit TctC